MLKNVFLVLSVLVFMAGTALAGTASSTLNVNGTVADSCVVSANAMAFGSYNGTADVSAVAGIDVTCTNTTPWVLGIDGTRQMAGPGGAALDFQIFTDLAHTTVFGTSGAENVGGAGTGGVQGVTAYGLIAAGQYPTPGGYTTDLMAVVTF